MTTFKLGNWYQSKAQVRALYREYWRGILCRNNHLGIIFEYRGSRRIHYGDNLDYRKGQITYIGEGKKGDQKLTARNRALIAACETGKDVDVFLDCGDMFKPKRLLYAGKWVVEAHCYQPISQELKHKVFQFLLVPTKDQQANILAFLSFTFDAVGLSASFEEDLKAFAMARHNFILITKVLFGYKII